MRSGSARRASFHAILATVGGLVALSFTAAPAFAAEGTIDHVQAESGQLRVLFSVPGLTEGVDPDLESVTATVDGQEVPATATLAAEGDSGITRTTVLAIDTSRSMAGQRFVEAKRAAQIYLETAPADVLVGIVTYAGDIRVVQDPTLDRAASVAALESLRLTSQTRLYDGVLQAVETAGTEGQRSVLVLSDGRDTSRTPIKDVTEAVADAELKVDVVALGQSAADQRPLETIANAGGGRVLTTDDPEGLSAVFEGEARDLAKQVAVDLRLPEGVAKEGSLGISIEAAGETYTDRAFTSFATPGEQAQPAVIGPKPVPAPEPLVSRDVMLGGLAAAVLGGLFLLLSALGVLSRPKTETLEDRINAYKLTGDVRAAAGTPGAHLVKPQRPDNIAGAAVSVAQKALAGNRGLEAALGTKLEAAGMSIKPAEWLLAHVGVAFGAALIGFLLTGGDILPTLVLFLLGAVVPYVFLGMKRSRRVKAFNGQLAETLQLMAGSLSAGLSLAQSADTVVREGTDPMAGEFRRALIEARLGVPVEDSLESIAERMESDDFRWVVMAIRIQRDVGGNLAELLLQVAATLREREYLRRQVKALSAEGRLSAWILGGLPPFFILYLVFANRTYLEPLISTTLGWLMIGTMVVLMTVGAFWMKKMVKVEV